MAHGKYMYYNNNSTCSHLYSPACECECVLTSHMCNIVYEGNIAKYITKKKCNVYYMAPCTIMRSRMMLKKKKKMKLNLKL